MKNVMIPYSVTLPFVRYGTSAMDGPSWSNPSLISILALELYRIASWHICQFSPNFGLV